MSDKHYGAGRVQRYIFCSNCNCRTLKTFAELASLDGRLRCGGCSRVFGEAIKDDSDSRSPLATATPIDDRKSLAAGEPP